MRNKILFSNIIIHKKLYTIQIVTSKLDVKLSESTFCCNYDMALQFVLIFYYNNITFIHNLVAAILLSQKLFKL